MTEDFVITVGWHAMVVGEDGKMYTPARHILWDTKVARAACPRFPEHDAPEVECTCGIYLWYTEREAMEHALSLGFEPEDVVLARMRVLEGARVVLHENGMRVGACELTHLLAEDTTSLNIAFYSDMAKIRVGTFSDTCYTFI